MKCFGLIGHPLGHSFSARYFAEKFAAEGIDARYDNFDLDDIGEVATLRRLSGFNVTIPYKQAVIPYLDGMSDEARAIGAVNTVRVENGCFYGYNTDVIGFRESLRDWLSEDNASVRSALVLGTGGASKAVYYALTQLGIAWQLVSRMPKEGCLTYNDLRKDTSILASTALIVNCTPLGTFPNVDTCPDLPYESLNPAIRLYDLVYNPEETLFLRRGREQGCPVKNGLEMLHRQAEAAWKIWTL
ncbi:MAG: shikimate dehydrogenase [Bacteroidales bacterium]|nr:shikimate dehydrogenase [Candidatus Equimonas faecalis]